MLRRRTSQCLLALVFSACRTTSPGIQVAGQNEVQIEQLLSAVQTALARAQDALASQSMPLLKSVTLALSAEAKKEVGGEIKLYVVTLGGKSASTRSQEIEITLTPPPPDRSKTVGPTGADLTDALAEAIVRAARGVKDAGKNPKLPLVFSGLKVVLGFDVKTEGSGGVKFEILPVGFDASAGGSRSAVQKVTVQYENPEPKPSP